MKELERLNRDVNRALRELNGIAVAVSSATLANRKGALHEAAEALVHLDNLQRLIYASDPTLEYHYDPDRPATDAMAALARVVDEAEKQIKDGDISLAVKTLQLALEMEPPPLAYESIQKRLQSLVK